MQLTVKAGKNNKVHIYIDGEYRATVDSDFWYSEKYKNFKEIYDDELTALLETVGFRRAYNKALDYLTRRPYGEKELIRKLCEKDHTREAAEKACERLTELGLLNDEAYAELLAKELFERKGYSKKRVIQELTFRGIDREIAQNTAEALDNDAVNRIILIVQKKYLNKLDDEKGRRRTIDALLRLGYPYSDIRSALNIISETRGE